jgi:hypothetical protein
MLRLRAQFDVFTNGQETLSLNGSTKKIQLKYGDHNITLLGNFSMSDIPVTPGFQHTGTWFEFFSETELSVSDVNTSVMLKPGEYRLYSDKKLPAFKDLATTITTSENSTGLQIYPNPASEVLHLEAKERITSTELFSTDGRLVQTATTGDNNFRNLEFGQLKPGLYILRIKTANQFYSEKVIKK